MKLAVASQFSSVRELETEGSTSWNQQSEYEVGVRWSRACEDVSPEAEERPQLEIASKQRDWKQ
jgi:hypothetical protein